MLLFSTSQSMMVPYLSQWELDKNSSFLLQKQFKYGSTTYSFLSLFSYIKRFKFGVVSLDLSSIVSNVMLG